MIIKPILKILKSEIQVSLPIQTHTTQTLIT